MNMNITFSNRSLRDYIALDIKFFLKCDSIFPEDFFCANVRICLARQDFEISVKETKNVVFIIFNIFLWQKTYF